MYMALLLCMYPMLVVYAYLGSLNMHPYIYVGEAVGEGFCDSGERWTTGGISEEVCDAIHALHGVPHPPTDSCHTQRGHQCGGNTCVASMTGNSIAHTSRWQDQVRRMVEGWRLYVCSCRLAQLRVWNTAGHYAKLATAIYEVNTRHKSLVVWWLDLATAYRSVHHNLITFCLKHYGVADQFTSVVANLYSSLSASICTRDWSTPFIPIRNGVFQGEPLSVWIHILIPSNNISAQTTTSQILPSPLVYFSVQTIPAWYQMAQPVVRDY